MARPKGARNKKPPSYRLHKGTGQAVVTIDGRDIYLGPFGSPESRQRYEAAITRLYVKHPDRLTQEVPWRARLEWEETFERKLIPLAEVPKLAWLPEPQAKGERIGAELVYEWATAGSNGVRLETMLVGTSLCTTQAALFRFFERCATGVLNPSAAGASRTPSQREKAAKRASEILRQQGL